MPRKTKTLTRVVFDRGGNPELEVPTPNLPPPESSDDLRAALGLPCDALICRMLLDSFEVLQDYSYPNWQDYIYELVGVPPRPTSPPEAPRITWRDAGSPDPVPVIALRQRVYCKGIPIYIEARWHPTTGETTISMHGLEKDTRKESVDRAYKGITLLQALEVHAGRQIGTGFYPTQAAFHMKYLKVLPEAEKQRKDKGHVRVRDEDIFPLMGLSRTSFYQHLRKYSRPVIP